MVYQDIDRNTVKDVVVHVRTQLNIKATSRRFPKRNVNTLRFLVSAYC